MDLDLRNRVAVLVGASRGIGLAIAETMAAEGARVVVSGRDEGSLSAAREKLEAAGAAEVEAVITDARDRESLERLISMAGDRWGQIDALVNVVGTAPGGRFEDLTDEDWETTLNPKLWTVIRATRAALPLLRRSDAPRVVNIAGNSTRMADPAFPTSVTVNAAVIALTRTLARDLGSDGILVNVVCPGPIETQRQKDVRRRIADSLGESEDDVLARQVRRIALGRIGQPEDVGELVAFLASPRNTHVSGAVIDIDGAEG